jgi:hypothetical protein
MPSHFGRLTLIVSQKRLPEQEFGLNKANMGKNEEVEHLTQWYALGYILLQNCKQKSVLNNYIKGKVHTFS